jgi:hypothetical protein
MNEPLNARYRIRGGTNPERVCISYRRTGTLYGGDGSADDSPSPFYPSEKIMPFEFSCGLYYDEK